MHNIFDDIDNRNVALMIEKGLHGADEGELFFEESPSESLSLMMGGLKIQILILIVVLVLDLFLVKQLVLQIQLF